MVFSTGELGPLTAATSSSRRYACPSTTVTSQRLSSLCLCRSGHRRDHLPFGLKAGHVPRHDRLRASHRRERLLKLPVLPVHSRLLLPSRRNHLLARRAMNRRRARQLVHPPDSTHLCLFHQGLMAIGVPREAIEQHGQRHFICPRRR
jgi:hypothetical protein